MNKIKKVLLINPKTSVSKGSIRRLPTPLGLMYIAAVLEKNGYDIAILDSSCEGYENVIMENDLEIYGLSDKDLIKRIKEENPDFVGVACVFSKQIEEVYRTCKIVKSILPNVLINIGGIHPTFFSEKILKKHPEIDFVILKEGEFRTLNLLNSINNKESYEKIDGISFRKDGKIIVNPPTKIIENLDDLPLPARHLINMEKYIKIGLFGNPFPKAERVAQVLTSRGCPFRCHFCSTPAYWGKYRRRSADNIITELRKLKEKYNVQEIQFRDDNILTDRKNALKLFKKMREFNFVWYSGVMIKNLDEEIIKAMAECGCYKITISIESGNERVLKELIHKPLNLNMVKPVVELAHKYGISVHADNIIGYPGETKEEMLRTFEFNKEVGVDSASFFVPGAYIGSDLYNECIKRGWLDEEGHKGDLKNPGIHIKETDPEYVMSEKELVELVEKMTKEFNEFTKKRNPGKWDEKYNVFLKKHKEEEKKILGRVV